MYINLKISFLTHSIHILNHCNDLAPNLMGPCQIGNKHICIDKDPFYQHVKPSAGFMYIGLEDKPRTSK